ncbi:MAG TPA: TolC family protein [Gemmatimonadales bacterium]|nr:TolC family protein [Gemmatimonadales bacterium]
MRRFLFLIVALGTGQARAQQPAPAQQPDTAAPLEVTLDEAVRRAIDAQPAMIQARGAQRNAGASQRSAFGAFLPSLTLSGGSAHASGNRFNSATNQIVSGPSSTSYTGGLSANLILFDGFARIATSNAASAAAAAADAGYVNERFLVTLSTKQAFYATLSTADLLTVAQANTRQAQQQFDIAVQKLHAGSATRSDSLRSVVALGNAHIAELEAQAAVSSAQAALGRQIGVNRPVRAVPDSTLAPFPDTAALQQLAINQAPAVAQADAQARTAHSLVTVARAQYFPTFSAGYSNGYTGFEAPWNSTGSYVNNWSLRFSVSLPIFNGFTREQQLVSASVDRDVADAVSADTRRSVSQQLVQLVAALQTAYEQIAISGTNVDAATEDLRVQQERYRVGASTILDLLTSEASLTLARTNLVVARFNYNIARAQLEALVGRTL